MKNFKKFLAFTLAASSVSGSLSIHAMRPETVPHMNNSRFFSDIFQNNSSYYKELEKNLNRKNNELLRSWLNRVNNAKNYLSEDYKPPRDVKYKILISILCDILAKASELLRELGNYGANLERIQYENIVRAMEENIDFQDDSELNLLQENILNNLETEKRNIPFNNLFNSITKIYRSIKTLKDEITLLRINNSNVNNWIEINLDLLSKLYNGLNLFREEKLPLSTFQCIIAFAEKIEFNLIEFTNRIC